MEVATGERSRMCMHDGSGNSMHDIAACRSGPAINLTPSAAHGERSRFVALARQFIAFRVALISFAKRFSVRRCSGGTQRRSSVNRSRGRRSIAEARGRVCSISDSWITVITSSQWLPFFLSSPFLRSRIFRFSFSVRLFYSLFFLFLFLSLYRARAFSVSHTI